MQAPSLEPEISWHFGSCEHLQRLEPQVPAKQRKQVELPLFLLRRSASLFSDGISIAIVSSACLWASMKDPGFTCRVNGSVKGGNRADPCCAKWSTVAALEYQWLSISLFVRTFGVFCFPWHRVGNDMVAICATVLNAQVGAPS